MAVTELLSGGVPTPSIRLTMRFGLETLGTCYLSLQGTSVSAAADSGTINC